MSQPAMSKAPLQCHAGVATDTGMVRSNNEDRAYVDESAGIFLVVDGMGGHAAGEVAAETAISTVVRELEASRAPVETAIREAITRANNEIHRLAETREEWQGMACVLTLAVSHDEKLTVGHVGDSRLYLVFAGGLRKLTSDHSPVGEREDRGDLTEEEAMSDPRRNQVFRDVGSQPREAGEEDFIETRTYPFRADAAFLLCTDGLSDVLTSAAMNAIVQRYDGDPAPVALELVEAANAAGGKDNVTAIFVAGPEFVGAESRRLAEARTRHSVTRMRGKTGGVRSLAWALSGLLAGAALGATGLLEYQRFRASTAPPPPHVAEHIKVDPANPNALRAALAGAHEGDTIEAPKGDYLGPVVLREGVDVISLAPGEAVIHAGPDGVDPGVGIVARRVTNARISGFRVEGTPAHPLTTGLLIHTASPTVDQLDITGASDCAIRIEDKSAPAILASNFHENHFCGIMLDPQSVPRLIGNRFVDTGTPISADLSPEAMAGIEHRNLIESAPVKLPEQRTHAARRPRGA